MFRKPKGKVADGSSRNTRKRIDEEASNVQRTSTGGDDNGDLPIENVPIAQPSKPKHVGLSFNDEEGDDVSEFKLKKRSSHHKQSAGLLSEKTLRKHQMLVEQRRARRDELPVKEVKKEGQANEEEPRIVFHGKPSAEIAGQKQRKKPEFRIPGSSEKLDEQDKEKLPETVNQPEMEAADAELRGAFSSSFAGIPDARAVYEARKKREIMRQMGVSGPGEYIPLDDTVRLRSEGARSGERARLIREDENDMSDEEETGSFYSAKKLLQNEEDKRREEQAHFLQIEQGDSEDEGMNMNGGGGRRAGGNGVVAAGEVDSDEDELARWEREQIRKGVSSNKVAQMQDEMNATSMHFRNRIYLHGEAGGGEAEMDIDMDMDVELLERGSTTATSSNRETATVPPEMIEEKPPVKLEEILENLHDQLAEKRTRLSTREQDLDQAQSHVAQNTDLIHKIEHTMPELERKFKLYQEIRMFVRDLLDCLNEKIVEINALDEKVMEMWRQRRERLVQRRRQDVQDQYERCAATAAGRPFTAPNAEYAQREAEREARRNRRRREREQQRQMVSPSVYFEGMSSDEEETTSREVHYKETIVSTIQSVQDVFVDTADEFCHPDQIMDRLLSWLALDEKSFEEAYVPLCLPKLLGPFVRLQMLAWRPLKEMGHQQLHSQPWYGQLLTAGLTNSGLDSLEHPVLVQLIPAVVEKIVFPKIARIVREQWDPLSLSESTNLAALLRNLVEDYSVANAQSKRMNEILTEVHTKIRDSLEHDTFIPLYSREAIENQETGCGAFLDRQYWKSIKLMNSILCFRTVLSDSCLEELLIDGLVNRYAVLALQVSVLSSPVTVSKCRALIDLIPSEWLPSVRPSSYRSLASLLEQVIEQHQHRDRKFAEQARKFVELAKTIMVKEEAEDEDEKGEGESEEEDDYG